MLEICGDLLTYRCTNILDTCRLAENFDLLTYIWLPGRRGHADVDMAAGRAGQRTEGRRKREGGAGEEGIGYELVW